MHNIYQLLVLSEGGGGPNAINSCIKRSMDDIRAVHNVRVYMAESTMIVNVNALMCVGLQVG